MRDIFPRWIEKKLTGRESKGEIKKTNAIKLQIQLFGNRN